MSEPICVLLGAGGHARVLLDCLRAAGGVRVHGLIDADRTRWGSELDGARILGGDDLLATLGSQGVSHFAAAVGDLPARRRLFEAARWRASPRSWSGIRPRSSRPGRRWAPASSSSRPRS
jgi:FlaA1/EpsC-like NDP-sugar epimerase